MDQVFEVQSLLGVAPGVRFVEANDGEVFVAVGEQPFIYTGAVFAKLLRAAAEPGSPEELVARVDGTTVEEVAHCWLALAKLVQDGVLQCAELSAAAVTVRGLFPRATDLRFSFISMDPFIAAMHRDLLCSSLAGLGLIQDAIQCAQIVLLAVRALISKQTLHEVDKHLAAGRSVLLLRLSTRMAAVGPLIESATYVQWLSLRERMRDVESTKMEFRLLVEVECESAVSSPTYASIAAAAVSPLILKHLGSDPDFSEMRITRLDLLTLTISEHCFAPAAMGHTSTCESHFDFRRLSTEDAQARLDHLVDPIVGIVWDLKTSSEETGTFVTTSAQIQRNIGCRLGIAPPRRGQAATGKGDTAHSARLGCIAEAIERYSLAYRPNDEVCVTDWPGVPQGAIDIDLLCPFSEEQYGCGFSYPIGDVRFMPERITAGDKIAWSRATWLAKPGRLLVPTAYCYFNPPSFGKKVLLVADSNGCAMGSDLEEAQLFGLLELVERDSCALWWYQRAHRAAIHDDEAKEIAGLEVMHALSSHEREFIILDITSNVGVPCYVAISWKAQNGGEILFGLGCHVIAELAAHAAVLEHQQMLMVAKASGMSPAQNSIFWHWLRGHTIDTDTYVQPHARTSLRQDCVPSSASMNEALSSVIGRLGAINIEPAYLDATRSDIGAAVVRTFAPGLCHFWPRLGCPRLYEQHEDLNEVRQPMSEASLNPIPFFL